MAFSGEPLLHIPPERAPEAPYLVDVDPDMERLYSPLAVMGCKFSGRFQSLTLLKGKFGLA